MAVRRVDDATLRAAAVRHGQHVARVAAEVGLSPSRVSVRLRRLGIRACGNQGRRAPGVASPIDYAALIEAVRRGGSIKEIARRVPTNCRHVICAVRGVLRAQGEDV